jgi:tetratricopeptide (TPR) repeat protein
MRTSTTTSSHPRPRRCSADQRQMIFRLTCGQAIRRFALFICVAILLTGCDGQPYISGFVQAPTPTPTMGQLSGPAPLVGIAEVAPTTSPAPLVGIAEVAPTTSPAPLVGIAEVAPTTSPAPLVGIAEAVPNVSAAALIAPIADPIAAANLIVQGRALQVNGYCTEAILHYEQAIAADASFSDVYSLRAFCFYDLGRYEDALASWQEALRRDPGNADALAGLGTVYYRQGQATPGLGYYLQAVALDPGYADEGYLLVDRLWGGPSILDSRPLRAQISP